MKEHLNREYSRKYDDILYLPHPTSKNHPRMSLMDRAAQFSPFAALTGYEAAVKETARLTDRRIELDEYEKAELDGKLQRLKEPLANEEEVTITYFVPDEKKEGGSYATVIGYVKTVDDYKRQVILKDGSRIPLDEIIDVSFV